MTERWLVSLAHSSLQESSLPIGHAFCSLALQAVQLCPSWLVGIKQLFFDVLYDHSLCLCWLTSMSRFWLMTNVIFRYTCPFQLILLLIVLPDLISSIRLGRIEHSSVRSNGSRWASTSARCSDCLCRCMEENRSRCHGINCFPSNHSCQYIEEVWIEDADLLFNAASHRFVTSIDLRLCSCYRSQLQPAADGNLRQTRVANDRSRYIIYHAFDQTLIVLGEQMVTQYFASNLTRFRQWSAVTVPLHAYIDSSNVYISFHTNVSVNRYDLQMNFLQSVRRPVYTGHDGQLYGLTKWRDLLLIADRELNSIWSLNLTSMTISMYRNMSSENTRVFNIVAFDDRLYISQYSLSTLLVLDLISLTRTTITFPNSIALYRMQLDSLCQRLWFGVDSVNYTVIPVLDPRTNHVHLYETQPALARTEVHLVAFDAEYSMYTISTGAAYFDRYQMPNAICWPGHVSKVSIDELLSVSTSSVMNKRFLKKRLSSFPFSLMKPPVLRCANIDSGTRARIPYDQQCRWIYFL